MKTHDQLEYASWIDCHGRKAKEVWFSDGERELAVEHDLICCVQDMGDRTEAWIVVMRGNEEVTRHNVRYIETIVWEDKEKVT